MNIPELDTWIRLDQAHTAQGANGEGVEEWQEGPDECAAFIQPSGGKITNSAKNEEQQISFMVVARFGDRLKPDNSSKFQMVETETGLVYQVSNCSYIQGRKKYIQFLATHRTQINKTNE